MRAIVADSAGNGTLIDKDGGRHELSADTWAETDVRDVIVAGATAAWVRYREDGRTVEVAPGQTYHLEGPANDDVIDVRSATGAAHEIAAAIQGLGTDEQRIYAALALAPHDHSRAPWLDQLRFIFTQQTGRDIEEALRDELSGDELERALQLMQ